MTTRLEGSAAPVLDKARIEAQFEGAILLDVLVGAAKPVDMATRLEGSAVSVLDKARVEDAVLLDVLVGAAKLVDRDMATKVQYYWMCS